MGTYPLPARYRQFEPSSITYLALAQPEQWRIDLTPERHADTRDGIQHGEAANGLRPARLPKSYLSFTHTRETSRREAIMLSQPDSATVLGTTMARGFVNGFLLSDIPHPNLLISRGGNEHAATGIP
jgi:hypothetical protein